MAIKKTPELCEEIIHRISEGEPLRQICRSENMPNWGRVYEWMDADKEFAERIARAREIGYDAIAQETLDIADDSRNDWMENKHGDILLNAENVQRSRLRIDTRLKLLSKWSPKKYGDRVTTEISGPDGGPVQVSPPSLDEITRSVIFTLTLAENKGALTHNEQPGERAGE